MIVGSLNIRGGGSRAKKRRTRVEITAVKVDIFLIHEMKLIFIYHDVTSSLYSHRKVG